MAFVKNQVKTNNSIGETLWQNVTQKWDMIEGISKSGLFSLIKLNTSSSDLFLYKLGYNSLNLSANALTFINIILLLYNHLLLYIYL